MSTVTTTPEITVIPETPAPIVEAVEVEQLYEYQPTDVEGKPLGGKQVIKYKTQQELVERLTAQNVELQRHMRDINRKNRLGEFETEDIPVDAQRFDATEFILKPRELSAEERVQISRDLLDPDKMQAATDVLFEARFGGKPDVISRKITQAQEDAEAMRAKAEGDAFVAANPDYFVCPKNFQIMANWMIKNGLAPVRRNFQLAYDKLSTAGLLEQRPIVREAVPMVQEPPVNTPPEREQPSRITSEANAQPKRTVQDVSGLSRSNAGDGNISAPATVTTPNKTTLTLRDIELMPSAEYKRKLSDPEFVKLVNRLESEAADKRRNRLIR